MIKIRSPRRPQKPPRPTLSPSSPSVPPKCQDFRVGLDLPDRYNVGADLLDRNLPDRASKIAIHSAAGEVTYAALFQLSNGAARRLLDLGVRREERVLIAGYDSPGWVASFLGAIRIGAVPVPVNPLLQRSEDYVHYVEDSLARVVVVDSNTDEKLRPAARDAVIMRADQ